MIRVSGAVALLAGLMLDIQGLVICGIAWLALGFISAAVRPDKAGRELVTQARRQTVLGPEPSKDADGAALPPVLPSASPGIQPPFGRFRAAIWIIVATGVLSVVLGVLEIGFDGANQVWKWVPITLGGVFALPFLASTVAAKAGKGLLDAVGNPTHPALVTIEGVEETGTRINERPQFKFQLHVRPEGKPDYRVTRRMTTPYTAHGRLVEGATFKALIDPMRHKGMDVDWASLTAPGEDPAARLQQLDDLLAVGTITLDEHAETRQRILGGL